ncbi:beta-galactosidase trimerization domain-containing protein, partial [Kitasatospora phosalacinea]|uniref:beta-galactosidase trimerization domain-containing protein n=1 Tax=Kitasatospora phosalacinea TaxID=2065 RepID=UPI0035DE87A0
YVVTEGAETVWRYADGPDGGPAAGGPAVTRHALGNGHAWYVSARLDDASLARVLRAASADAGLPERRLPHDVEVVERVGEHGRYLFAINHGTADADLPAPGPGTELLTGTEVSDTLTVPAGRTRVLRH